MKRIALIFLSATLLLATGCPVFRGAGRSVTAVGEGTGHAVSQTGRAISGAATETERRIFD